MRKILLSVVLLLVIAHLPAQKKSLSYDQAFKGAATSISKAAPQTGRWIDDNHFLETRKDEKGTSTLYSVEVKSGKALPYSDTAGVKINPAPPTDIKEGRNITASPDGKWWAYTKKDNNLYVYQAATGRESRLTSDGSETVLNGYASWVYYEEILGRQSRYRAFWWSPDSRHISFMRFDESAVPVFPIYWADGQHGHLENQRYPKAGDKNPEVRIGILSPDSSGVVWADFNSADDQYFGMPYWTPAGQLWVQWMPRSQNRLVIYGIDLGNGKKNPVYEEKQATWIDLDDNERIEFLANGREFILKSDKTGWRHFYLYDLQGHLINPLTEGEFTTGDIVRVDEKARQLYFTARKENSARWDFYVVGLDGKNFLRLSAGDYSYSGISLSPGGKYFIATCSNINTPPVTVLMDNKGHRLREIGNTKGSGFDDYALPAKELVRVKSADSLFDLPVLITYPVNFDPHKKYPVLVSIYGGPNAGTVYDSWRSSGSEIWWAQEGLVQVAFDNRSSGHFGKKGMNYIYRQLGKYETEDFMACGRWLKAQPWVDRSKLCITGGSFGGYMTFMALTYGADVFDYGVANSAVTDWQLYDSHYTERYMDLPSENPEGYRNTAVLTYINKYKGLLRIIHGTADDNVHMQNSLQVISKLEDLKKHFEFMAYPGERHGISGAKGLHNRTEAYNFYYHYLLGRPLPEAFWK